MEQGQLDLSGWDFQATPLVVLGGQWEFLWNAANARGVAPSGPLAPGVPMDFYQIPSLWRGATAQGVPLAPHGQAAYRLRVRFAPNCGPMSLYLAGMLSVCRVWVDGHLLAASGEMPSGQPSAAGQPAETPRTHLLMPRFTPVGGTAEIVLQVSNHTNAQGGLNTAIVLGPAEQVERMASSRWITGAFIAGVLLAMCAYHLMLYFARRADRSNLYFGLFCLAWSIATLFSPASGFLMNQLTSLPWRWHIDLALLPYGFTIPLMVAFYHALFPKRWGRAVTGLYAALGAAYVAYLLLSPPDAFGHVPLLYYMLTRTAFLYLMAAFALDFLHRERSVLILAPGYLALAGAELSKILFDLHITGSALFARYGMLVFILSHSVYMFVRFSQAFQALEENVGLKREVALRRSTERGLRLRQLRLSRILDAVDEAVFAVNQSREIAFCNHALEKLTGRQAQQVLGQPLALLLAEPESAPARTLVGALGQLLERGAGAESFDCVALTAAQGGSVLCSVYATVLELEDEHLLLLNLRPGDGKNHALSAETDAGHNAGPGLGSRGPEGIAAQGALALPADILRRAESNRQRLQRMEETLLALETGEAKAAVLEDLRAIDALLENLCGGEDSEGGGRHARQLAVLVMNTAVDCWRQTTGQGKGELATQSGLWNVYMERDGYLRTQTLDKYLSEDTLPQRPRWRQVAATAEFVLAACAQRHACHRELQNALARLKQLG